MKLQLEELGGRFNPSPVGPMPEDPTGDPVATATYLAYPPPPPNDLDLIQSPLENARDVVTDNVNAVMILVRDTQPVPPDLDVSNPAKPAIELANPDGIEPASPLVTAIMTATEVVDGVVAAVTYRPPSKFGGGPDDLDIGPALWP